jgi:hypothetical protein
MAELKTKKNDADVIEFINTFADTEQKKADAFALVKLMQRFTGFEPKMWGTSMIGFGQYHYKSTRSSQEGDWPMVGFSPRKATISLYVYSGCDGQDDLLKRTGYIQNGQSVYLYQKAL